MRNRKKVFRVRSFLSHRWCTLRRYLLRRLLFFWHALRHDASILVDVPPQFIELIDNKRARPIFNFVKQDPRVRVENRASAAPKPLGGECCRARRLGCHCIHRRFGRCDRTSKECRALGERLAGRAEIHHIALLNCTRFSALYNSTRLHISEIMLRGPHGVLLLQQCLAFGHHMRRTVHTVWCRVMLRKILRSSSGCLVEQRVAKCLDCLPDLGPSS
mmetsp:Transcript_2208/g.5949  ORF Transcript_2208/g.5949 Transcript_2208/m.5949 type:complete len:217 (-) Transcript_2208:595-1245(-)